MKKISVIDTPDEMMLSGLILSIFISVYAAVAAMAVIMIYLVWQHRFRSIIDSVRGVHYLMSFIILTFLVSAANANPRGILVALALAMVFIVAAFTRQIMTRPFFERLVDLSCAASLFSFLVIVLQRLKAPGMPDFRAESTFMNANYYASVTEVIVLFSLYRLLQPAGQSRFAGFRWFVLACNLAGLYLSGCRTAFLAIGIGAVLLLLLNRRYRLLAAAGAGLLVLIAAVLICPDLFPRCSELGDDFSTRSAIWLTALRGILRHPAFGQGYGTYLMIYPHYFGPRADHAHNLLLEPLLDFGLIGTLLLALYFRINLQALKRLNKSSHGHEIATLIIALLSVVVIHGITDITFFSIQTGLLLILSLSSCSLIEHPAPDGPVRIRRIPATPLEHRSIIPRKRGI